MLQDSRAELAFLENGSLNGGRNYSKKGISKGKKKGANPTTTTGGRGKRPSKGEDITYMFGISFDDEDEAEIAATTTTDNERAEYAKIPEMRILMEFFPTIPPSAIHAVLADKIGNIELAAEELQAQSAALSQAQSSSKHHKKQQQQQQKQPTEAERAFPRLDSKACATAAVVHPSSSNTNNNSHNKQKSEWASPVPPSLVEESKSSSSSSGDNVIYSKMTAAGLLNYKALVEKFSFVPEPVLHDIFINTGQSYNDTVLQLWDIFPDEMEASSSPPPSPKASPAAHKKVITAKSGSGAAATVKKSTDDDDDDEKFYNTEDFIEPVVKVRKAIEDLKRTRSVTIAYKGGNVKTSVPAEEYKHKAAELFDGAVEEAARIGAAIITRQKSFIDFHYLTVNETLAVLERLFARLTGSRSVHRVLMVTGLGKHNPDGKAHLMPAVEQWLSQRGVKYTKKSGSVFVRL